MEVILIYAIPLLLAWPLGRYMAAAFTTRPTGLDRFFGPVENALYRLGGIDPKVSMDWRAYGLSLLKLSVFVGLITYLIFCFQGWLPLNPDNIGRVMTS